ncbi:MAG: peroxiredoxin, partial [Thermodesulfobacteriota bacterium]
MPAFGLPDQTGRTRTFSDLTGPRGLVLYVYPKDSTPGCTTEAQEFQAIQEDLAARGFGLAGVSKDSVKSHQSFAG